MIAKLIIVIEQILPENKFKEILIFHLFFISFFLIVIARFISYHHYVGLEMKKKNSFTFILLTNCCIIAILEVCNKTSQRFLRTMIYLRNLKTILKN